MKQYMLSIYQPEGPPPPPEFLEPVMRAIGALNADMVQAGVRLMTAGLHPPDTATVVRADGDTFLTTDGPFAEGKEHIGGFYLIAAPDLDAALDWGRRLARIVAPLSIEVRPVAYFAAP
jgi:hypothetical protein